MTEATVKRQVVRILKAHGAYYTMPHQRGYSKKGVPDFVGWAYGVPLAIEAKFGNNAPSAHQEEQLIFAERAGGLALVIDEQNIQLVELWLQHFRK